MKQNNPLDFLLSFAISFAAGMLILKLLERRRPSHFPIVEAQPPFNQSEEKRDG